MQLFAPQFIQATTITRSLLNGALAQGQATGTFVASLILPVAADLLDSGLVIVVHAEECLRPGYWSPLPGAVREWQGAQGIEPTITFCGTTRRLRFVLDPSRPVTVGVDVSQSP